MSVAVQPRPVALKGLALGSRLRTDLLRCRCRFLSASNRRETGGCNWVGTGMNRNGTISRRELLLCRFQRCRIGSVSQRLCPGFLDFLFQLVDPEPKSLNLLFDG